MQLRRFVDKSWGLIAVISVRNRTARSHPTPGSVLYGPANLIRSHSVMTGTSLAPAGLSPRISAHQRTIRRIPLLTHQEEITLARAVQKHRRLLEIAEELKMRSGSDSVCQQIWAAEAGLSPKRLQRQLRWGERARERMVTANLRLVVTVARRYQSASMELDDLIQEGTVGLIKAVDRFDPARGYKLSTYAFWWIRESIGRAITDQSRTIRLPAHARDRLTQIRRAQQALAQRLGRAPELFELAAETGLKPLDLRELLFRAQQPLSLDACITSDTGLNLMERLACGSPLPGDHLERQHLRHDLQRILHELPAQQAEVMRLRHGIDAAEPMSLCAVARTLGISRDTARGHERRAAQALRNRSMQMIDYLEA